jgi:hypothetical protein
MKPVILFFLLCLLLPVFLVVQDLLPALPPARERLQLFPVLFCFGVLALPLTPALCFALIASLMQGLELLQFQSGHAETGVAPYIVFFLCWTVILQMASEATHGLRWELHALASALVTFTMLGGEYLLICAKRGGLPLDSLLLMRMAVPCGISLLLAPLLYFLMRHLVPLSSEGAVLKNQASFDL